MLILRVSVFDAYNNALKRVEHRQIGTLLLPSVSISNSKSFERQQTMTNICLKMHLLCNNSSKNFEKKIVLLNIQ